MKKKHHTKIKKPNETTLKLIQMIQGIDGEIGKYAHNNWRSLQNKCSYKSLEDVAKEYIVEKRESMKSKVEDYFDSLPL